MHVFDVFLVCVEGDHVLILDMLKQLTDFGLSKIGLMNSTDDLSGPDTKDVVLPDVPDHLLDKSQRSAVGTPDYLAPEILLGTEHGEKEIAILELVIC